MVKKISAILLALVLCLSVVVIPASAEVELGDATVAFALEWDKEYYAAGDTAVLSVYMDGDDSLEFTTGSILIGLSSDVFDPTIDQHSTTGLRENTTMPDWMNAWYKDPSSQMSQLAATVVPKVQSANTAEENAAYDWYVKFTAGKNTGGWHENTGSTKQGFPGTDFDPTDPILQISLVVRDDIADGTTVQAGITSGSLKSNPVQTSWKYLKNPGGGTTTSTVAATAFDVSKATNVAATIGEEPAEFTPLTVSYWKDQIRFDKNPNGTYFGTFDYRILATIDNFDEVIGTDYDKVTDVGFIFNKGENAAIDVEIAKAQVEGGAKTYSYVDNVYVSTAYQGETYVISCLVNNIPYTAKDTELSAMAYVEYVVDDVTYYAYSAVQTSTFTTLYNTYYSQEFGA